MFPFGIIAGVAAVDNGLDTAQAIALSPVVFAGAAQLAMVDLFGRDATLAVIVLTALVINARFLMYSAALAPHLVQASALQRVAAAYLLTDQAFAVSIVRYGDRDETAATRLAYYFGAAMSLWVTWQAATVGGVVVGSEVPPEWSLDFAVPLVFIALLVPALKDRGTVAAAVIAVAVAVAAQPLPYNLGLIVAALLGIIGGLVAESRSVG